MREEIFLTYQHVEGHRAKRRWSFTFSLTVTAVLFSLLCVIFSLFSSFILFCPHHYHLHALRMRFLWIFPPLSFFAMKHTYLTVIVSNRQQNEDENAQKGIV